LPGRIGAAVVTIVFKEEILLFDLPRIPSFFGSSFLYVSLSTYIHLNICRDVRASGSFEQCVGFFLHFRLAIVLIRLDERVLAAARDDNEDLLLEIFEHGNFDINCQDGCVFPWPLLAPNAHRTPLENSLGNTRVFCIRNCSALQS